MARSAASPLARAEQFVWLTARVLEQHRFTYHFLAGTSRPADEPGAAADAVESALDAYRTTDGGYGHALEPELRGPVSQPPHVAHALRVLDGIGRCGGQRMERVCRYLTAISTEEGALPALHPSLGGAPPAPWLPALVADPSPASYGAGGPSSLLTTGPVVGLLHRNQVWHAWLFRATDYCWSAVESLDKTHPYEVAAAVAFLDGAPDGARAEAAAEQLGRLVRDQRLVVLEPDRAEDYPLPEGYAPGAYHFAHDFARTPESLTRRWFTEAEITLSLDHLAASQEEDGGWPVPPAASGTPSARGRTPGVWSGARW